MFNNILKSVYNIADQFFRNWIIFHNITVVTHKTIKSLCIFMIFKNLTSIHPKIFFFLRVKICGFYHVILIFNMCYNFLHVRDGLITSHVAFRITEYDQHDLLSFYVQCCSSMLTFFNNSRGWLLVWQFLLITLWFNSESEKMRNMVLMGMPFNWTFVCI